MTTGLVLRQMLRERTRSLVFWTLGTVVFVVLMIAAWPSVRDTGDTFDEYVQSLPEGLQEVFGLAGASIASPEGYLVSQTYSNLWPIILLVLGFGLGAWAVAGSEADGTLEMVLANPVRRGRTAAERFVGTALAVAVVTAVSTAALALIAPFVDLDEGLPAWGFWAAGLTMFAFVLVHVALTFAVGAATGSKGLAIAVGAGVAVAGFMLQALASIAEPLERARSLSPWYWFLRDNPLTTEPTALSLWLPLGLSVLLVAVGILAFDRRDLAG
jgi:ABC-2 type transport system permease protein